MKVVRCHDLSLPLHSETLRYPGDPPPHIQAVSSLERGDPLTVSELTISCHVGTHVDAPAHFVAGGARVDELAADHFYGRAIVRDVAGAGPITVAELGGLPDTPRVHLLLRTGNHALLARPDFDLSYRTLTPAAAQHVAALQPLSVGFDYYSLDPPDDADLPAHRTLAHAGIPVFLPLQLRGIVPGEYLFVGLPLPLVGTEAAPVRAVLFETSG